MVRGLFSVLFAAALAVACSLGTDGARDTGSGPTGSSGLSSHAGVNGMLGNWGGAATNGGASVSGAGVPGGGAAVVGTGAVGTAAGTTGAGGSTGPLCGGPAIPANKGRCSTGIVAAKGS